MSPYDEVKPIDWTVQISKTGRKAFSVSLLVRTLPNREHFTNSEEHGSVILSVARKKGRWRFRQRWPVFPVPGLYEELGDVAYLDSSHALAKAEQVLNARIAALRLGYKLPVSMR